MNFSSAPFYSVSEKKRVSNGIGGFKESYKEVFKVQGYLDFLSRDKDIKYQAFIENSTHVFITNYCKDFKSSMVILDELGNMYSILLIDNPVSLNHHLEIYLKFEGDKNV